MLRKIAQITGCAVLATLLVVSVAMAWPSLSYVDINGSTVVTDTHNQFGGGGVVVLNDYTAQKTGVNGTALGWNAQGEGIFNQQAGTSLYKQSSSPFGSAEGSVGKFSEQKAKVNVAGPTALACADLNQVNKGSLFTMAGPGSTFTLSSDLLKQDMNGFSLGNAGLKLSQYAERSTAWSVLATTPNGTPNPNFTQNWGNTYASAEQKKLTGCPGGFVSGSDTVGIKTITGTNYVALPGYTAANGFMGANLNANASGNVPTTLKGSVDMGYKTFVLNGPTLITQQGSIVASVKVVK
ncbi:MAG: hypothetical protein WC726_01665 [Parcubacteria group bacterium]|jgi:hypothetical protein